MRKIYLEEFASRFMYSNTKSKETNYSFWFVDPCPEIDAILKSIKEPKMTGAKCRKSEIKTLKIEGRKVKL